jgi:pimeloyl-ACP methyl ester carboxylesterase
MSGIHVDRFNPGIRHHRKMIRMICDADKSGEENMPTVSANSIEIAYETFGRSDDPAVVLIMGLGEQMVAWPAEFCRMLADAGFYVIRFDNRDTGLSTKPEACGLPDVQGAWVSYFKSEPITPPYTLKDMASDVIGLLDALDIEKACICGFSLGGIIAQNMAYHFPGRLSGVVIMASTTGERHLPPPTVEAQRPMTTHPPQTREGYVEHVVWAFEIFSGGSRLFDADCKAEIAGLSFDRSFYPQGFMRQSMAMLADGSRRERLEKVRLPVLILHGELDPLVRPVHGQAIADAVDGAKIVVIPDWGHGLDYPLLWPELVGHLAAFQRSMLN